jgi:hypothetical protein
MVSKQIKDEDFNKLLLILKRCDKNQLEIIAKHLDIKPFSHPLEKLINVKAEILLDSLLRSSYITLNGIRGIIAESTFNSLIVKDSKRWKDIPAGAQNPYDFILEDNAGQVRIQIKLQRKVENLPWIRTDGCAVVETYRTRSGKTKDGESSRPYRYGEFDLLGVCMEPSHGTWESFLYIPQKYLKSDKDNIKFLHKLQSVPLIPKDNWTTSLDEAVELFRKDPSQNFIAPYRPEQFEFPF